MLGILIGICLELQANSTKWPEARAHGFSLEDENSEKNRNKLIPDHKIKISGPYFCA
jgi:hypothetical protein